MFPDNLELVKNAKTQGFKFDVTEISDKFLITLLHNDLNDEKSVVEK